MTECTGIIPERFFDFSVSWALIFMLVYVEFQRFHRFTLERVCHAEYAGGCMRSLGFREAESYRLHEVRLQHTSPGAPFPILTAVLNQVIV